MTYERLKAFCEANNISMSQFVETRVGDFLGSNEGTTTLTPIAPRPTTPAPAPRPVATIPPKSETRPSSPQIPMTSAAARYAVEPPPPVIKKLETSAPKPTEKRPDQIFTF